MDKVLNISNISKKYSDHIAVDDISLSVKKGSIFGLLGPNGAGKTTLLRIVTGIIMPDSGTVHVNGQLTHLVNNAKFIGYMPEERGLYKKMKAEEQIIYLAQLKGMPYSEAKKEANYWIEKLEMTTWRNKKVEEISKGMAQKLQFVTTIIHKPSIVILDEPFSGLDPLNAEVIKNEIYSLAKNGATIIFSTHRMEQVEEICDGIALINKGKVILNDTIHHAKSKYYNNQYIVDGENLEKIPEQNTLFSYISHNSTQSILKLNEGVFSHDILRYLGQQKDCTIHSFKQNTPSLNDIFIQLVQSKLD